MTYRLRFTVLATLAVLLMLAACNQVVLPPPPVPTHLAADGITLKLLSIEGDEITVVDTAPIPSAGLLAGHRIFNIVPHPSLPLLYVASANDCAYDEEWCWGNGRIDTFRIVGSSISHQFAFVEDASQEDIFCAQEDVDAKYVGQVGYCAPVGMVFSSEGTRLYVDDDELDGVQIFAVDATGRLTFIAEGATTEIHGMAIDPTDTYLYNGTNVIQVSGDVPADVTDGFGGNKTTLVDLDGTPGLITTVQVHDVGLYDLSDPVAPVEVDILDLPVQDGARDMDFMPSLERIVTVGRNQVHAASFDGTSFSLDDSYSPPEPGNTDYRGVALSADGTRALAGWFTVDTTEQPGGVDLFSVAEDGTLARLDRLPFAGGSRVVIRLP